MVEAARCIQAETRFHQASVSIRLMGNHENFAVFTAQNSEAFS